MPSHEADDALSSQKSSESTQKRGVDHDAAALENRDAAALENVPRQDQSMGLLQAPSKATKSIAKLKAMQKFLDWSVHGQLYVPLDLGKQDRAKALMMMLWFSNMATSEEKVGKGKLKRGPSYVQPPFNYALPRLLLALQPKARRVLKKV